MNALKMILTVLMATSAAGVRAQVPFPPTITNQTSRGNTPTQSENHDAGNGPYSGQTTYDALGGVPQYRVGPSSPSYIGVLGEKWETDKRGRRSTFIHNGQELSVGEGLPGQEHRPQITLPYLPLPGRDSLTEKNANLP